MNAAHTYSGAPLGQNEERPTWQGGAFETLMRLGACVDDTTVSTRWAAYAARRRLRLKCAGGRWPREVCQ